MEKKQGDARSSTDVTLTAAGLTLLGVILSIGVTVGFGFGIGGPWWLKFGAGAASSVALVLIASWSTSRGRGGLARLANWIIGANR